ncbi:hypothetical protein XENTR_v10017133 [Xenopus tropicalis]|nr:hypothetical protein XENTR_v10017133 [Xenopus tropicalis]
MIGTAGGESCTWWMWCMDRLDFLTLLVHTGRYPCMCISVGILHPPFTNKKLCAAFTTFFNAMPVYSSHLCTKCFQGHYQIFAL